MTISKKSASIYTNLPAQQFERVLTALESGEVREILGTSSVFAESREWQVEFEGGRYRVNEFLENVISVTLVSANPSFIQTLIAEHERNLKAAEKIRDYDKAKKFDQMIKHLAVLGDPQLKPASVVRSH